MKRIAITICAAVVIISCGDKAETKVASATTTNTEAKPEAEPDSATKMKNWQAYMTPGEAHKMMAAMEGEWTGDITMWMKPGAEPMKSTATAVNKMIMGGRYQLSTHKGDFGGMPFEGQSTLAYDNAKKTYISTWIDNMGTGIMVMEGTYDSTTKTTTTKGRMVNPENFKEMDVRETYQIIDENTHMMSMYCNGYDGKEYKNMEIKFTRKKK
jgi:hypothetical protein